MSDDKAQRVMRRAAVALMLGGVVAAVGGAYLVWGTGVALLVCAGLLMSLSLMLGWE